MYIVMVTPEIAPAAKAGGLGDVVQGLSRELQMRGNEVEIILPKYDCMRYDRIWGLTKFFSDLWVPYFTEWIRCDVLVGFVDGLKCFFIEAHSPHNFFNRGMLYGQPDDAARFAFFSRAALEFMLKTQKQPDIIHCHDWQTGLVPVLLFEVYKNLGMTHPRVCYTLHNLGHQGITGDVILRQVGLHPNWMMTPERMLDNIHRNAVNLMKGGIVFSNFVTTVSPRYAEEIRHSSLGQGLQSTLRVHGEKVGGVLNGIDYAVWNPEIDPHIPEPYGIDNLNNKVKSKQALRHRLLLRDEFKPIVCVVSRLDRQKGVDLIQHGIFYALHHGCQFVLLGTAPERHINDRFWSLKHQLNDSPDCHLELSYDEELAHLMYAGSDMILIPSVYEPCGLTQMIAMKYGTVPVVRNTGGLADTVFDANFSDQPFEERNGYVFNDLNPPGMESALSRAIGLWHKYPEYFRQLRLNGMKQDYSWNHPGSHYLNIYNYIKE
jgi:starch synthase